jgi:hypothetical protein
MLQIKSGRLCNERAEANGPEGLLTGAMGG